jgi:hypothetical protein
MITNTYQLSLNFEQILTLIKQLSDSEKLILSQELEKERRNYALTQFIESFQTDELSLDTISTEVNIVRAELYAKQQAH